jgi:hypothetical protein
MHIYDDYTTNTVLYRFNLNISLVWHKRRLFCAVMAFADTKNGWYNKSQRGVRNEREETIRCSI